MPLVVGRTVMVPELEAAGPGLEVTSMTVVGVEGVAVETLVADMRIGSMECSIAEGPMGEGLSASKELRATALLKSMN